MPITANEYGSKLEQSEQRRIDTLRELVKVGDTERFKKALDYLPGSIFENADFMLIFAQMLMGSGNLENANHWINKYVEEKPNDFDGWTWYGIISSFSQNQEQKPTDASIKTRRLLLNNYIEKLTSDIRASWTSIFRYVISDQNESFCFKGQLVAFLIEGARALPKNSTDQILQTEVISTLSIESLNWPIRDRLLWTGLVLYYSDRTDKELDNLVEISSADGLELGDFVGMIFLVNKLVSEGNTVAFLRRFDCLSKIYFNYINYITKVTPMSEIRALNSYKRGTDKTKKIAIHSGPLLGISHAPTSRVLEIAASLKKRFGYDVRIFATGSIHYMPECALPDIGYTNAQAILPEGLCNLDFYDTEIGIWTSFLDDSQYKKHHNIASEIIKFDPDVVIVYGDCHPIQTLIFDKIPMILQPSNCAPPIGPSTHYLSTWNKENLEGHPNGQKWPDKVLGTPIFATQLGKVAKPQKRVSRDELVPNSQILLAIVGSRVSTEIRGDFALRLAGFLSLNPFVNVLVIGSKDKQALIGHELEPVTDQIHCMGFAKQLLETLTGCDIYLNPKRQGGGTSVMLAMSAGCAIVSLNHGDGATFLNKKDLSKNFDSYFATLEKLVHNKTALFEKRSRMPDTIHHVCNFERAMEQLDTTIGTLTTKSRKAQ